MSRIFLKISLITLLCTCLLSPAHAAKKKSVFPDLNSDEWNFALGFADYKQGRWKDAERFFDKLGGNLPIVSDYVLFYRGAIANELHRPKTALEFLERLKKEFPSSALIVPAKLEFAKAMMGLGRFSEARTILNDYKRNVNGEKSFDADILIAKCFASGGPAEGAINYVRALALSAGSEEKLSELYPLMDEVKHKFKSDIREWLNEPVQQYRLAKSFAGKSQWDEAVEILEKIASAENLSSALQTEAKWLLARSLRSIHRYDEAISIMENLLRNPNARGFMDNVLSTLATTYTKKNEYEKAIAIRRKMMEESPLSSAMQAQMAVKIAFLYMDEGRYEDAAQLWRSALKLKALGRLAVTSRWYLAWCNYMAGNYAEAVSIFNDMLRFGGKRSNIHDRLLYWRGRALLKDGKSAEAHSAFLEVTNVHPGGYYAELSKRRLEGDERNNSDFALVEKNRRTSRVKFSGDENFGAEGNLKGGPHMQRAIFFNRLKLRSETADELRMAVYESKLSLTRALLELANANFVHDVTYRMAETTHTKFLKTNMPDGEWDRIIWEAAFPRAYAPLVEEFANGVSPLFVWSIMRNESAFRSTVTSPAGAIGLMQIMPTTANRLLREEGLPNIDRRSLYEPLTNIRWAVSYLKKLSRLFPDNPTAWAAAYSAGEEAATRWLANGSANDIEEWIEEIPYEETNLYVKKVITSYWKYQRLYN